MGIEDDEFERRRIVADQHNQRRGHHELVGDGIQECTECGRLPKPTREQLLATGADILILGTGRRQQFPSLALLKPVMLAGRTVDVMDTSAACRTYNILMSEGRTVAAALIIE